MVCLEVPRTGIMNERVLGEVVNMPQLLDCPANFQNNRKADFEKVACSLMPCLSLLIVSSNGFSLESMCSLN